MIRLSVAPYCHNCSCFEPTVIKKALVSPHPYQTFLECTVVCESASKCKVLYDHIKNAEAKDE